MAISSISESVEFACLAAANVFSAPARQFTYSSERVLRPWRSGEEKTFLEKIARRVEQAIYALVSAPVTIAATPFFLAASSLALCFQQKRIKIEEPPAESSLQGRVSILFLNTCLQGGMFATLTGDVVHPFDRFDETHATRIEALANFMAREQPDILCLQEVHDRSSIPALKKALRARGYTTFISDEPATPFLFNSGLFIASKYKLDNVQLIPYPQQDRGGVTYGALQGCLSCEVDRGPGQKKLALLTTHLAYGYSEKLDQIRRRQLYNHVLPLMQKKIAEGNVLLFGGDLNEHDLGSTLAGFHNLVDAKTKTTRVAQGQIRGKRSPQERVDAALISPDIAATCQVLEPRLGNHYVTDHYGLLVTID